MYIIIIALQHQKIKHYDYKIELLEVEVLRVRWQQVPPAQANYLLTFT